MLQMDLGAAVGVINAALDPPGGFAAITDIT